MLQSIRDNTNSWLKWLIVVVVAAGFAFWGIGFYLDGLFSNSTKVAKVNGTVITQQSLTHSIVTAQRDDPQLHTLPEKEIQSQVLQQIIARHAVIDAGVAAGLMPSGVVVDDTIKSLPAVNENGHYSPMRLKLFAQAQGMSVSELSSSIATDIMLERIKSSVAFLSAIPSSINHHWSSIWGQTRSGQYVWLPYKNYINRNSISQAQIQAYYQAHHSEFMAPMAVQLHYILLKQSDFTPKQLPSHAELQQLYQQQFANNPHAPSYDSVRNKLVKNWQEQQAQQQYLKSGNDLANETFTQPDSLAPAAKTLGLQVETSGYITKNAKGSGLFENPAVIKAAFSPEVLEQGQNSNVINLSNKEVLVVRLAHKRPKRLRPLAQVQSSIIQLLETADAKKRAQQQVSTLLTQLKQQSFADVMRHHSIEVQRFANVSRQSKTIEPTLLGAVFAKASPTQTAMPVGSVAAPNGLYIFQVRSAQKGTAHNAIAQQALHSIVSQMLYLDWQKSVIAQADVEYYDHDDKTNP